MLSNKEISIYLFPYRLQIQPIFINLLYFQILQLVSFNYKNNYSRAIVKSFLTECNVTAIKNNLDHSNNLKAYCTAHTLKHSHRQSINQYAESIVCVGGRATNLFLKPQCNALA